MIQYYMQTDAMVINQQWAEMLGYDHEELEPTAIQTWLDLCHPEDVQRARALLEQHVVGELAFFELEARLRHRQGGWV